MSRLETSNNKRRRVQITTSAPNPLDFHTPNKSKGQAKRYSSQQDHRETGDSFEHRENGYTSKYNSASYAEQRHKENKKRHSTAPGKPRKKTGYEGQGKENNTPKQAIAPVKYQAVLDPDSSIRLNKFLANSGVASRREADLLISSGKISVNGTIVTELGVRVKPSDIVMYQDKRVQYESKVYILLNKPKNCVTTSDDPECRLTVLDLVRNACTERIYPVGRLDRQTTGVLLLTNDGELGSKLTHPSFLKKKIYHVWLDKDVKMEDMQRIADGIELEDGEIHADALSYVHEDDHSQVGIEIHSGRNRIVRRIFEHLGYRVVKLDRVYFAGLTKKNLPRGRWRYLDEQEVNNLRMGAFE